MTVLFIRSFTPDYDGKIQKYFKSLDSSKIKWSLLGWERSGHPYRGTFNKEATYYNKKSSLGGGAKNIINLIFWNFFVLRYLIKNRSSINVIHVIDFDSAIPVLVFSLFFKIKIIFDIYDKYTSMRNFPLIIKKTIDKLEKVIIHRSDLTILADESRYRQQGVRKSNKIIVLENVPFFFENINNDAFKIADKLIHLGYFGVLEKNNRGLEDLSSVVLKLDGYILHVAGYGELEDYFKNLGSKYLDKIKFYGPMKSGDGLKLMSNVDILAAFYYRQVENHLFAAPNKYYEHLILGKPLLTTKGTPPGEKVECYQTGWAIDEGEVAIKKALIRIRDLELKVDSIKIKSIWNEQYSTYFEDHYVNKYANEVAKMSVA